MNILEFGQTQDNKTAHLYVLENEAIQLAVSDYGATLVNFIHKDSGIDIVLGYDDVNGYETHKGYLGASIGRVANRIEDGEFSLNGIMYHLAQNDNGNHLHGGEIGFDKRIFQANAKEDCVHFYYLSPAGEEGYPGDLEVEIIYELLEDGVRIISKGKASEDTLFAYTSHGYFNVDGTGEILGQQLQLYSDVYIPCDENALSLDKEESVEGTAFDFRVPKALSKALMSDDEQIRMCGGIDNHFPVDGFTLRKMAHISGEKLSLETYSDFPGIHIYTANFKEPVFGKNGSTYLGPEAICFEAEYYPNAINNMSVFEKPIVRKGETLEHTIEYHVQSKEFL